MGQLSNNHDASGTKTTMRVVYIASAYSGCCLQLVHAFEA